MSSPTLIASYAVYSAAADPTTLTTPSFTPSNGEVITVKLATWDRTISMGTPTDTATPAQTYTKRVEAAPGAGFFGYAAMWTATVAGSPGSMTISSTPTASSRHSMVVERWSGAKLAGSPAVNSTLSGSGAPSANITTAADNSVISWCSVDEQSRDPTGHTYLLSATEDGLYDGHIGSNSVHYFAYASPGVAGTYAMGMSTPNTQSWTLAGVEIQAIPATLVSGSDTVTAAEGQSLTAALTAGETAAGADSASLTAQIQAAETATGVEGAALTAVLASADAGSSAEAATLAVAVTATETGAAAEAASLTVSLTGADSGSSAEQALLVVQITDSDGATCAEGVSVSAGLLSADAGAAAEQTLGRDVATSDVAAAIDSGALAAAFTAADSVFGADGHAVSAAVVSADTAAGADAITALAASIGSGDSGAGADTGFVIGNTHFVADADTASCVETATVSATITGTDSATGAEAMALASQLASGDTATGGDTGTASPPAAARGHVALTSETASGHVAVISETGPGVHLR